MSSFTEFTAPLLIQYDEHASKLLGKDHWRVAQGFRFYVNHADSGEWVNVPAGYLTDGASVPRLFWGLIPPWGKYGQAAVVHDILCEYLSITKNGAPYRITREECDDLLLEAMTALKVPCVTRHTIHSAVCLYRKVSGVNSPTNTPLKRQLESEWRG